MISWTAGGATGTTLGLVSGCRKPMLTKQQRLQQDFEAPWLRLLRSVSLNVEDLAGAEAALNFVVKRLEKLEADARQFEQQLEAHRDALNAAGQSCSQFQACSPPFQSAESISRPFHRTLPDASPRQKRVTILACLSKAVTCTAETKNNAVKQQPIQLQQNLEACRADGENKLTTQVAALQVG